MCSADARSPRNTPFSQIRLNIGSVCTTTYPKQTTTLHTGNKSIYGQIRFSAKLGWIGYFRNTIMSPNIAKSANADCGLSKG